MRAVALIAARGGSKGLPRKNLVDFCGKPLLAWSVEQALAAEGVESVWVSSDDDKILEVATAHGARAVRRPGELAGDEASSESAWLHALDEIGRAPDVVLALQATSPLREPSDIERGLRIFEEQQCDSLFSGARLEDFYIWERASDGSFDSINYDWRNRGRRQERPEQYVENGSFYLFGEELLRESGNRLGGRIGVAEMELWKSFEIDSRDDLETCAALMRRFLLEPQKVSA